MIKKKKERGKKIRLDYTKRQNKRALYLKNRNHKNFKIHIVKN